MDDKDRVRLQTVWSDFLNEDLNRIILSNPVKKDGVKRVSLRPVRIRGTLLFQAEEVIGNQAFHKNMDQEECARYLSDCLEHTFRQGELNSVKGQAYILVGKKGTVTIKRKKGSGELGPKMAAPSHNRPKRYILEEGIPAPFLRDLGVMTADGVVVKAQYDKFRQINRFLEYIEDVLPKLDKSRENVIIDFGCGKSYLTFAMYYYLHVLKGYAIRVIGLDLKKDVISHCNQLSKTYGYENLSFYHGDIASFEGVDHVDMVVTLHACDTATDYAIYKAVKWGAAVILSVPCCQHELNAQMHNDLLAPVLRYGLIKERMAALYTDALRAEILESQGYRAQILEFIDMEHTPKNILIRAVRQKEKKDNQAQIKEILDFLGTEQTLAKLFFS